MSNNPIIWHSASQGEIDDLAHALFEGLDRLRGAWADAAQAEVVWPCTNEVLAVLASVGRVLTVYDQIAATADEEREGVR